MDRAPRSMVVSLLAGASMLLLVGCSSSPTTQQSDQSCGSCQLDGSVQDTLARDGTPLPDGSPLVDLATDAGPGCTQPVTFEPPGSPSGWRHTSTGLLVVTQGPANHRGQDVVVGVGRPQVLIGKFAYGPFDKDLKDEDVEVFLQREPPCGAWSALGTVATSEDGQYGTQYGIEDDGGRVFFTIPVAQQLPRGRYPVRMLVKGDHSVAAFTLYVVEPQTEAVVFDIDGTLTTDDFQLITQLFDKLLAGSYTPQAYPGGEQVAGAWAQKHYLPVYLTGRPDFLRSITASWLVQRGLPPGPLHLTDTNAQALPTAGGVGQYKSDFLAQLKGEGLTLSAGYGNATTDIQAYAAAGVAKSRTFIIGANAGADGTTALPDYPSQLSFVQSQPVPAVPAPPQTFGW